MYIPDPPWRGDILGEKRRFIEYLCIYCLFSLYISSVTTIYHMNIGYPRETPTQIPQISQSPPGSENPEGDGNGCSRERGYGYHLIVVMKKCSTLNGIYLCGESRSELLS